MLFFSHEGKRDPIDGEKGLYLIRLRLTAGVSAELEMMRCAYGIGRDKQRMGECGLVY